MSEVLLVTGSSGMAAATARRWSRSSPVFIVGVDRDGCRSLATQLPESGFYQADIRDETAVQNAVAACIERFAESMLSLTGISARSLGDGPLHQCSTEAWDTVMDVNARGTFLMCREVLRVWMRESQAGVILNMGSSVIQHPEPPHFATLGYAASKGAVEAMTLSAAYYAPPVSA